MNVLWAPVHTAHELVISLRTLVLGVAAQHALDAHAHALNALHGRPTRVAAEKIEADDAVGVDCCIVSLHISNGIDGTYCGDEWESSFHAWR